LATTAAAANGREHERRPPPLLAIVVPCLNEELVINDTARRLVEAMWFDVPVLAYRSTATPETLGEAGITFESKDDLRAVAMLAKLLTRRGGDEDLRRRTIAAGRARRAAFTPASVHVILDKLIARMENLNRQRRAQEVA